MLRALLAVLTVLLPISATAADLRVFVASRGAIAPGELGSIDVQVRNTSIVDDAVDPVLRVTFPAAFEVVGDVTNDGWACSVSAGVVECYSIGLERNYTSFFSFQVRPRSGDPAGAFPLVATVTAATADPDVTNNRDERSLLVVRKFRVASNADEGPGSFRSAIEDANRECRGDQPCQIVFELASSVSRTVELLSPLPTVTASNIVIGASGVRVSDHIRPVFRIVGSRLTGGNGLMLQSGDPRGGVIVENMSIAAFPENGIAIAATDDRPRSYEIRSSEITSNRLRGIAVTAPEADVEVTDNFIAANVRSAIALWSARHTVISGNEFVSNGASGVFVTVMTQSTYISRNTFTSHPDFGVAIEKGAPNVGVVDALMNRNGALDIDWGLDGPTANDPDDSDGVPNYPELQRAFVEGTTTRVEGEFFTTAEQPSGRVFVLRIVAADRPNRFGRAEMQRVVYEAPIPVVNGRASFSVVVPGELRGRYVSAVMSTRESANARETSTSEVSPGVQVE